MVKLTQAKVASASEEHSFPSVVVDEDRHAHRNAGLLSAGPRGTRPSFITDARIAGSLQATLATPWLTVAGAVGHIRIR
jgi:hypothetical protein